MEALVKARRRGDSIGEESSVGGAGGQVGKRTRSQSLPARTDDRTAGVTQPKRTDEGSATAPTEATGPTGPLAHDDPFGMHLLGDEGSTTAPGGPGPDARTADDASPADAGESTALPVAGREDNAGAADGEETNSPPAPADAEQPAATDTDDGAMAPDSTETAHDSSAADSPQETGTAIGSDLDNGTPSAEPGTESPADAIPPPAVDDTPARAETTAARSADSTHVGADLDRSSAAAEYQQALLAIGQREQLVRNSFTQQRAAIRTIGTTQAALARSEAKAAADRIRGPNGVAARTIGKAIDGEVTRLSMGTQDAMRRCTAASRVVTDAIGAAADSALPNANLDFRSAVEAEMANDLYNHLIHPARRGAREQAHEARARDIDALAGARDRNIRALRSAGDMIVRQVDEALVDVPRSVLGAGEKLATAIERNMQSQLRAIDESERGAAGFFARARVSAQPLLRAGRAAKAHREQLTSKVDDVASRASAAVSQGAPEFDADCTNQRAIAKGQHAALEIKLTTDVAVRVQQVRVELAQDVDRAIISANSYAATAEFNSSAVAAQLPEKFASMVRSAFAEARKSRTQRKLEGMWDALKGIAVGLAKFVAAGLVILFAPLAFGIAALLGKVEALAGLLRDAAMGVVGMADAFAERFRILFRTWDDWPWYGKVAGLWATTLVAIGDATGLTTVFEGVSGHELMTNRELSDRERGEKMGAGGFATIATLGPAWLQERQAAAAAAKAGASEAAGTAPESVAGKVDEATPEGTAAKAPEQPAGKVVMAGDELDIYEYAASLPPEAGTLDVVLHGTVDDFYVVIDGKAVQVSHRTLARYIEKSGQKFQRVRLISCKSGLHPKGAAQHLANKLGVVVEAPTDFVHINKLDGSMTVGPRPGINTGRWEEFAPTKSELRYSAAKDPPPESVRDRLRRRREEHANAAAEAETYDAHSADDAAGDSKRLGHDEATDSTTTREGSMEPHAVGQVADDAARRAKATEQLAEIEVEHVKRDASPAIEHDTYFVTPSDAARMAELVRVAEPGIPVRLNARELLVGSGADAWYFVLDERAGNLGGQRAVAVAPAEGGFGLPPSNVSTGDIWAMRGARTIETAGETAPRGPTQWTPEEAALVRKAIEQNQLVETGHVSVSLDGGKTAHGWSPEMPPGTTFAEAKRLLGEERQAFPGRFKDDTMAFEVGEDLADSAGANTRPMRVPELLEKGQHQAMVEQARGLTESSPHGHGEAYGWPLRQPDAMGSHFAASNGFLAEKVRNCAAFLEKLGLKLPEPSGNMRAFMEALAEWNAPDAPIVDARPKRGTR